MYNNVYITCLHTHTACWVHLVLLVCTCVRTLDNLVEALFLEKTRFPSLQRMETIALYLELGVASFGTPPPRWHISCCWHCAELSQPTILLRFQGCDFCPVWKTLSHIQWSNLLALHRSSHSLWCPLRPGVEVVDLVYQMGTPWSLTLHFDQWWIVVNTSVCCREELLWEERHSLAGIKIFVFRIHLQIILVKGTDCFL